MIVITAETRRARVTQTELLTSGSAGIQCQFSFTEDWNGLMKMAVFRSGDDGTKIDVVLDETNTCAVPHEVLEQEGEVLFIGVYGANEFGVVIIPTVWASAGVVKQGVEPNTTATATPTPDVWTQILSVAETAKTTADDAITIAEQAEEKADFSLEACQEYVEQAEAAKDAAVEAQGYAETAQVAAETAESNANADALKSEGFAAGKQNGDDVDSDSPYYHNNSRYFSQQASSSAIDAGAAKTAAETAQGLAEAAQAAAEAAQQANENMTATATGLAAGADPTVTKTIDPDTEIVNLEFGIPKGDKGDTGEGVPDGGTANQYLKKNSSTDYDTDWATINAGEVAFNASTSYGNNTVGAGLKSKVDKETGKGLSTNDYTDAEKSKLYALPTATSLSSQLNGKVDKVEGWGLSTNDYTDAEKSKLAGIEAQANKTIIDDTLSNTGEAADAKAVGDALATASDGLAQLADSKADVIIDTASGAIASFPDGADGMSVKSLIANIDPIQDLHGYESPWPAGGGKNLLKPNKYLVGNTLYLGELANNTYSTHLNAGTYTLSYNNAGPSVYEYYQVEGGSQVSISGHTFTIAEDSNVRVWVYLRGINENDITNWQLESGSTATAYAPYSNICPISGRTGCEVVRTGKNLYSSTETVYLFKPESGDNKRSKTINLSTIPAGEYNVSLKCSVTDGTKANIIFQYYDGTTTAIQSLSGLSADYEGQVTFSHEVNRIYLYIPANQPDGTATLSDIQVEIGAATAYEPYTGTTIPISWQTQAGTVYGGSVDPITGVLTVTHTIIDMGDLSWTFSNNIFLSNAISDALPPDAQTDVPDMYCSAYKVVNYSGLAGSYFALTMIFASSTARKQIWAKDSRYTDAEAFDTAVTGQKLVYPLAQPQTYQLDAVTVTTLLGQNNVWADCGDVSVDYPADTKLYIDKKLAALVAALS